jgi:hypothetical protein
MCSFKRKVRTSEKKRGCKIHACLGCRDMVSLSSKVANVMMKLYMPVFTLTSRYAFSCRLQLNIIKVVNSFMNATVGWGVEWMLLWLLRLSLLSLLLLYLYYYCRGCRYIRSVFLLSMLNQPDIINTCICVKWWIIFFAFLYSWISCHSIRTARTSVGNAPLLLFLFSI